MLVGVRAESSDEKALRTRVGSEWWAEEDRAGQVRHGRGRRPWDRGCLVAGRPAPYYIRWQGSHGAVEPTVSVDVKQRFNHGAVEPTVSVDVKQHFNHGAVPSATQPASSGTPRTAPHRRHSLLSPAALSARAGTSGACGDQ